MLDVISIFMENSDEKYALFQAKLIPTIDSNSIIGVRTPVLRKLAKEIYKENDYEEFLHDLPHKYFEENQLHGFLISEIKDFDKCVEEVIRFLPYIDNWATCDQTSPKIFKKKAELLLPYIEQWLSSEETYTVRFAVGMLMEHFLDERFDTKYMDLVTAVRSEEYYINMMCAWCMATALAKQWDSVIPYIENHKMDVWTHNKTIQKARESYRITSEQKEYLKSLKLK